MFFFAQSDTPDMKCRCKQYSQSRALLGRAARISVVAPQGRCVERALAAGFSAVENFEQMINRDLPSAELRQLCDAEIGSFVAVSARLRHILQTANDIAYRTDGLFDVVAAGTEARARWTDMDLSNPGHVRLRRRLFPSLGGLSKGFAVDLAVQALGDMGVGAGLVDIGGCIRAFGPRSWRIDFHPGSKQVASAGGSAVPVALHDGSIAGLGSLFSRARLFDAKTGTIRSTAEWQDMSLLVRTRSCALADALSKVAALSPRSSKQQLEQFGAEAVVLTTAGVQQLHYAS